MFEKIKDMWYDVSDFLITFIIVVLIVGAIAFIMTSSLGVDFALSDYLTFLRNQPAPSVVVEEPPAEEPTPPTVVETPEPEEEPEVDPEETEAEEEPEAPTGEIVFTINPGDRLDLVAEDLLRQNIISSTSDFLNEVGRRNLETSLQVGNFTLETGMSIDDVIYALFP